MSSTTLPKLIKAPDYDLKPVVDTSSKFAGLWRLMYGYRFHYTVATLSQGFAALSKTVTLLFLSFFIDEVLLTANPILMGRVVDPALWSSSSLLSLLAVDTWPVVGLDVGLVLLIALGFILLALLEGAFTFLSGRLAAQTAEGVAYRLRNYLFDHMQRLSFTFHDKNQTGDLLQRCTSDLDAVRRFFAEQAVGIGRILALYLVNFLAIATINWQLALFSTMVVPVLIIISVFFFKRVSAKYELFQEQEAVLSTRLQENLTGVRVVKAFARQQHEIDRFGQENWEHFQRGREFVTMHATFWPLTDLLTGFQLVGSYFIGATMVLAGTLTVGNYVAFAGMVIYIIFPMRNLGRLIVQASTALVSYDRVAEIIHEDREPLREGEAPPVDRIDGAVAFENVGFEYEHGSPVLHDVTFHAEPGQTVALMGGTGSGKSSLVSLLPRFYDYSSGRITIDGVELRDYPRDFLRRSIGVVEQEPFLFSRSIRENITYGVGREVSDEEVYRAARAAAVHHVIESFPEGYNTVVGERGVTLSGGQKQRVALARTLLKNPRILILDDATSSVDTETEAAIRTALEELLPGRTAFIIAHRVQTVMNADLIVMFDHGRIVQMGSHEELLADEAGIYRRVFDMQSRIDEAVSKEVNRE